MRRSIRSKRVAYHTLNPISDHLTEYKGRAYITKEDLKLFPAKVTLLPIKRHHHKKQSHFEPHKKLRDDVGGESYEPNPEGNY
jgi:hypothetical protein